MPYSTTFCDCFTWVANGKSCRSKRMKMAVLKFTTVESIECLGTGTHLAVLMQSLQDRSSACIETTSSTSASSKATKRGRKQLFDLSIFEERFRTIERVIAWEDK